MLTRSSELKDIRQTGVKRSYPCVKCHPHDIFFGSSQSSTYEFVAAFFLRSRFCAALRAIVGKTSRAIATRNFPPLARAFAFAVTAAVVCLARVRWRRWRRWRGRTPRSLAAPRAVVSALPALAAPKLFCRICHGFPYAFAHGVAAAAVVCLARVQWMGTVADKLVVIRITLIKRCMICYLHRWSLAV